MRIEVHDDFIGTDKRSCVCRSVPEGPFSIQGRKKVMKVLKFFEGMVGVIDLRYNLAAETGPVGKQER